MLNATIRTTLFVAIMAIVAPLVADPTVTASPAAGTVTTPDRLAAGVREYPAGVLRALLELAGDPLVLRQLADQPKLLSHPEQISPPASPETFAAIRTLAVMPAIVAVAADHPAELKALQTLYRENPQLMESRVLRLREAYDRVEDEAAAAWQQALADDQLARDYTRIVTEFCRSQLEANPDFPCVQVLDARYYYACPPNEAVVLYAIDRADSSHTSEAIRDWWDTYAPDRRDARILDGEPGPQSVEIDPDVVALMPPEQRAAMWRPRLADETDVVGLVPVIMQPRGDLPAEAYYARAVAEHARLWTLPVGEQPAGDEGEAPVAGAPPGESLFDQPAVPEADASYYAGAWVDDDGYDEDDDYGDYDDDDYDDDPERIVYDSYISGVSSGWSYPAYTSVSYTYHNYYAPLAMYYCGYPVDWPLFYGCDPVWVVRRRVCSNYFGFGLSIGTSGYGAYLGIGTAGYGSGYHYGGFYTGRSASGYGYRVVRVGHHVYRRYERSRLVRVLSHHRRTILRHTRITRPTRAAGGYGGYFGVRLHEVSRAPRHHVGGVPAASRGGDRHGHGTGAPAGRVTPTTRNPLGHASRSVVGTRRSGHASPAGSLSRHGSAGKTNALTVFPRRGSTTPAGPSARRGLAATKRTRINPKRGHGFAGSATPSVRPTTHRPVVTHRPGAPHRLGSTPARGSARSTPRSTRITPHRAGTSATGRGTSRSPGAASRGSRRSSPAVTPRRTPATHRSVGRTKTTRINPRRGRTSLGSPPSVRRPAPPAHHTPVRTSRTPVRSHRSAPTSHSRSARGSHTRSAAGSHSRSTAGSRRGSGISRRGSHTPTHRLGSGASRHSVRSTPHRRSTRAGHSTTIRRPPARSHGSRSSRSGSVRTHSTRPPRTTARRSPGSRAHSSAGRYSSSTPRNRGMSHRPSSSSSHRRSGGVSHRRSGVSRSHSIGRSGTGRSHGSSVARSHRTSPGTRSHVSSRTARRSGSPSHSSRRSGISARPRRSSSRSHSVARSSRSGRSHRSSASRGRRSPNRSGSSRRSRSSRR